MTLAPTVGMIVGLLILALAGADSTAGKPPVSRMEWQDRLLQVGSSTLILADWLMTVDGLRKGYEESNPILGARPALGRANVLIASGLLANMVLVPKIKDKELRRGIWAAMILIECHALQHNRGAGLKLNFRF